MHIAIATPAFPMPRSGRNAGIERLAKEMCDGFLNRGIDVTIVTTLWNGGPTVDRYGRGQILRIPDTSTRLGRWGALGDSHYWSWGLRAGAVLRDTVRPDVVHGLTPVASTPALTRAGVPVVTTFHHPDGIWRLQDLLHRPFHRILEYRAYNASTLLITPSNASAEAVHRMFGVPRDRIRTVYWGVDPARFGRGNPPPADILRVLYVGHHERRKGIVYLLEAIALLRREGVAVRLTTVGGGDQLQELKVRAEELGISDVVTFMGYVRDPNDEVLARLYSEADVFAFPSLMEGFGFVLVEAMASGVPVVASNVSAIPEVVGDAGVLFPPRDSQALAKILLSLAGDPQARRNLGQRGRKRVEELFTWDRVLPQLLSAYEEAIDLMARS